MAEKLFSYGSNQYVSIAEALRLAKASSNNNSSTRVVAYLGDPALMLSIPEPKVVLTKVNDVSITQPIDDLKALDSATFLEVFEGVPQAEISLKEIETCINIVEVLNNLTGFFKSNGEARRALTANSISVNKTKVTEDFALSTNDLINNQFILLQSGKKNYFVVKCSK